MKIRTKFFGEQEIEEIQYLEFPNAFFGFKRLTRFAFIDTPYEPLHMLQSLEDVDTAFFTLDPLLFCPEYTLNVDPDELKEIGIESSSDPNILLMVIVTIPGGRTEAMTANLLGPVVVNKVKRIGAQLISKDPRWQVKHSVFERQREAL